MPHEIQFDRAGNLYIAERDNHVIRKVEVKSGIISTVAGTGLAGFDGDGGPGVKAQLVNRTASGSIATARFSSATLATSASAGCISTPASLRHTPAQARPPRLQTARQ
jgi:hypothetical protein